MRSSSSRIILVWVLVVAAILFGGGGSPAPLAELVVQLAALTTVVAWAFLQRASPSTHPADLLLWVPVALLVAIPALQLVPLPPALWHALPGREMERASLALAGADDAWRPLSLTPYSTLASLLSLIPPVAAVFLVSQLSARERFWLVGAIAALALFSGLVGVVQVASGSQNWLRFYAHTHYGFATGFQANRNAAADVMVIGLLAVNALAASTPAESSSAMGRLLVLATSLFLGFCVILTGSRTGTLLMVFSLIVVALLYRPRLPRLRALAIGLAVAGVVVTGMGVALRHNIAVNRTLARFTHSEETRPELWEDTVFAIRQYWPAGSGVGSFRTAFPAAERLEVVDKTIPNRAHQDYLEFTLEAGLLAPIFLLMTAGLVAVRALRLFRASLSVPAYTHVVFGLGAVAILALHSLVDYPMRSMSLATLAAIGLTLLSGAELRRERPRGRSASASKGLSLR